jgi:SAM-dependent methyltransferase
MSLVASYEGEVSDRNAAFWEELCGSTQARLLGVTDASPLSLKRFDDWYFDFYPYLFEHIPFAQLNGRDVLEVGLGYGSVAQRLAESGAHYQGLDIASGPVAMVNHRLRQNGLLEGARQGSILAAPFADASFRRRRSNRVLAPYWRFAESRRRMPPRLAAGGALRFMVYYAHSYRRMLQAPAATLRHAWRLSAGYRGIVDAGHESERAVYDPNAFGEGAPHTDWISFRALRHLCRDFASFSGRIENVAAPLGAQKIRALMMRTPLVRRFGLDLYAVATK